MTRRWRTAHGALELARPVLMGVVNVTPDSFSDGGLNLEPEKAIAHARRLLAEGADIVDVGGESTRPGAAGVPAEVELARVLPVVEAMRDAVISIDTSKGEVAFAALEAGAAIVNDVRAGEDPSLLEAVAASGAGLVLMHMQGTPRTMQQHPHYDEVVEEVGAFLADRARRAMQAGIARDQICIDPGIGFGKTVEHNLELLTRLNELNRHGFPVMVGTSRKSFLGHLSGHAVAAERDLATAVSVALAWERGAAIFRVHNVAACREALSVAMAIVPPTEGDVSTRVSSPADLDG